MRNSHLSTDLGGAGGCTGRPGVGEQHGQGHDEAAAGRGIPADRRLGDDHVAPVGAESRGLRAPGRRAPARPSAPASTLRLSPLARCRHRPARKPAEPVRVGAAALEKVAAGHPIGIPAAPDIAVSDPPPAPASAGICEEASAALHEPVLVRSTVARMGPLPEGGDSALVEVVGQLRVPEVRERDIDHLQMGPDLVGTGHGDFLIFGDGLFGMFLDAFGFRDAVHGLGLFVIALGEEQAAHRLREQARDLRIPGGHSTTLRRTDGSGSAHASKA